eukprot:TRINITY_DN27769_c0_g1_i2.p1 TRINITY_DN27769_c0_g1~~TRINITY_DN27769_c0_g1_i2.p1  ORF type:complete len:583 (-),score=135.36 TRINITY_DN27769_c0_g1_i2:283-1989(-)
MGQAAALITGDSDRYYLQKVKLGEGAFGTVWRAVDKETNAVVAVKQLDKAALPQRGVRRADVEREVSVVQAVNHANVTRIYGKWEDSENIFIAMEYCDGGDFGDKIQERGMGLTEQEAAAWTFQMLSAIAALHAQTICHRDIKPDNFMVHGDAVKLSDFGLAVMVPKDRLLSDKCGTPAFMAPEQVLLPNSKGYNHACDIWAAGVTMYMLMFGGRHPWITRSGKSLDQDSLLAGRLDFSEGFFGMGQNRYSDAARTLCTRLVCADMGRRLSAEASLQDVWFQQHGRRKPLPQTEPRHQPAEPKAEERVVASQGDYQGYNWWPFAGQQEGASSASSPPLDETMYHKGEPMEQPQLADSLSTHDPSAETVELRGQVEALQKVVKNQQEQNEAQWELLVQNSQMMQQLMKYKTDDKTAIPANAPAALAQQVVPPLLTRDRTQHFAETSAADGVPAQLPQIGLRCRYWSNSFQGWLPAVIQSFNASDSTFDLDVRPHAAMENMSPATDATASQAWKPGTCVSYKSSTANQWLRAVIKSYNPPAKPADNGTYNLDVRECADCDRIRPRMPLST